MYSIGLDIGTTSVCGILIDAESGGVLKSLTLPNNTFISGDNSFEKLQDATRLSEILLSILTDLLPQNQKVLSIGISGQMHGIVYLNKNGEPVSPLKIWQDGRGDQPYKDGLTYAEYMTQKTGYPLATGYGAVTYFYDKVNGLVPADATCFCTIHDLAAMVLTGSKNPIIHPSNGHSFGLYSLKNGGFDLNAIKTLDLDPDMFPEVCDEFKIMGEYKEIPVSVAIGDNQASILGSVSEFDSSLLINVGTGSQISCLAENPPENAPVDCRPLVKNSYILAGSSLCGGRAYSMLEKLFRDIASTVTGQQVKSAYPAMDKLMETNDAVSDPLEVITLFSGTRNNPQKRGSIMNISTENLTPAALCDGFMQGMVNELYEMLLLIKNYTDVNIKYAVCSGNGIRNNPALRRRFEKTFGLKTVIPAHKEEAAFGAALFSLVAAGVYPDISQAGKLIKYL